MNFESSFNIKLIYVFRINDKSHEGCLKVGEASIKEKITDLSVLQANSLVLNNAAKDRINQYTTTAGIAYELLYTESTAFFEGFKIKAFNDGAVHEILHRSGIKNKYFDTDKKANEWFVTDLETIKNAIKAAKEGRKSLNAEELSEGNNPISFRPEQREAIDKSKKHFKKKNNFLWNAKMRFGKTLSALQLIKEMGFQKSIIITHRPVVDEGWFEDFSKIFYDTDKYHYGSKNRGESFNTLTELNKSQGKSFIYFASMQDLRGSEQVGGKFDKNCDVFSIDWDFVIIDEAHEGTKTELGLSVINAIAGKKTKVLRLSGTPFNLLDDFEEDEIFTWDYVMEQRAKNEWEKTHWGDPNPYGCLPKLNIYTYDLSLELKHKYQDGEHAFNFREFFRVNDNGEFVHEKDIDNFLDLLATSSDTMHYPYSTLEWRRNFRHSLWTVPGVKEAKALSAKLHDHTVFGTFKVVNVAGNGDDDEENNEALSMVKNAIGDNPDDSWTITLSCGKLTTGVSVPAWTAVFMMSGSHSTSAQTYMQTIFRVQTPANYNGKQKKECFVFDFAPDRTLKVLAETAKVSAKAGHATEEDKVILQEFLNFCPVVSFHGSDMTAIDVPHMMQQLKRVYVERVVRNGFEDGYLYSKKLYNLDTNELTEFDNLKKIIGSTPAMAKTSDVTINEQGFTNEQHSGGNDVIEPTPKQPLTPEQQAAIEEQKRRKQNRDAAVSILRGISIRMPMMLYGAEIASDEEITIDNFTKMVDQKSWDEFMPKGVTKQKFNAFKKYYDEDIFASAGKRIREIARSADSMEVEDRIERIVGIFATFRNPDKETVLTPWRVVNIQLGDTLGGYVFYDKAMQERLVNPRYVEQGDVTDEVYSKDSRILEINSKTGLYSLFVAYSIYRNRVDSEPKDMIITEDAVTKRRERREQIWQEVLRDNIFVICKTPMAKNITNRTLRGFKNISVNSQFVDELIDKISNKKEEFIKTVSGGKFWGVNTKDMKFNAVVGNPPYQEMDGGGTGSSAVPVYNKFVDVAKLFSNNYVSLIMPARWYSGGRGLDEFRDTMLNDTHIAILHDFDDEHECFANVDIAGGICYFLWNKNYDGKCRVYSHSRGEIKNSERYLNEFSVFIRYQISIDIINKIKKESNQFLNEKVFNSNPFGFRSFYVGATEKHADSIALFGSNGITYVKKGDVTSNKEHIENWKVIMSKAGAEHAGQTDKEGRKKVVSRLEVLDKNTICSESYLMLGSFDNKDEAVNMKSYVKTRFFRFLLSTVLLTQNISRESYKFVPLQDFTSSSDIDWSKSVAEIDQQLYKKYGLEKNEIEFVEKMIKGME